MNKLGAALIPILLLTACGPSAPQEQPKQSISVRSAEQDALRALNPANLAIALKRAIQDGGYVCRRVEKAGFVGQYKNLDMWTANCSGDRANDWAVFVGPDGSAQVRDCGDVAKFGLPECKIVETPAAAPAG